MSRATVLIVEDDPDVAYILTHTVERLGFSVVGSEATGERAVKAAGKHRPDIVLMDISLAGTMDGIEAARAIARTYHIPVVYITALSDDRTLERVAESTPFGYILKPFQDDELRTIMDIALVAKAA